MPSALPSSRWLHYRSERCSFFFFPQLHPWHSVPKIPAPPPGSRRQTLQTFFSSGIPKASTFLISPRALLSSHAVLVFLSELITSTLRQKISQPSRIPIRTPIFGCDRRYLAAISLPPILHQPFPAHFFLLLNVCFPPDVSW